MIHWLLYSDAGVWAGFVLIWAGIIALAAVLVPRYGGVTLGPDPTPRRSRPLADATTVILPRQPIEPNYARSDEHRSELADWFPMADTVDLTPQLAAVAAYFERTTVTRTVTEVRIVIAEPRPRHRLEDVHSHTQPITAGRLARVLEAGRPQ